VTYQLARAEPLDGRAVEPTLRRRVRTIGARSYEVRGRLSDPSALTGPSCTDIGVRVDTVAVPVRATPDGFVGCAPVDLSQGWHRIRTRQHPSVRRLWLSTGEQAPAPPFDRGDRATLTSLGRAGFDIRATTNGPAAIVSGQSADDGWSATVDGHDAGASVTLDTQAAWGVTGAGTHRLEAQHDAQRGYRIALAVTAAGLLLCLFLLVRGRFR
jgi:hypothetical protein